MKLTVTAAELNNVLGVTKKLEGVKDTQFQIKLLQLVTELENAKTTIFATAAELIADHEVKIKELEVLNKEKDDIVQKYAIKDEAGLFVLAESITPTGETVENYTFPDDEKLLAKRDKELKPVFEKIKTATNSIETLQEELFAKKAEVKIRFFEPKDKSQWFDLAEFKIFTALTTAEIEKQMKEGKS